jgi:hypothetical protein
LFDSLTNAMNDVPHGELVFSLGAAVLVLQLAVLAVAWRRRRRPAPTLRLHALAGLAIFLVPLSAGLCVHAARETMLSALGPGAADDKVAALNAGISGQLNAIPFATTVLLLALPLWLAGLKLARDARAAPEDASWPPAALLGLGLLPIAVGILKWCIFLIQRISAMAGVDPDAKVVMIGAGLDFSREHLALFALASRITIIGLAVVAVVLALVGGGRMTVRAARVHRLISLAALGLGAALFLAARPMRAENDLPWPPPAAGDRLLIVDPPTPALVGPDPIERAPVVLLFVDRIALDGSACSLDSLQDKLVTLRSNFQLLHPGTFHGSVVIVADGAVSTAALGAVLKEVHAAEYPHPLFAFTKAETLVRPLLGTLHRVLGSGVRTTLVDPFDAEAAHDDRGGEEGTLVRLTDFPRYEPLARRMLAVRTAGSAVVLKLGK